MAHVHGMGALRASRETRALPAAMGPTERPDSSVVVPKSYSCRNRVPAGITRAAATAADRGGLPHTYSRSMGGGWNSVSPT